MTTPFAVTGLFYQNGLILAVSRKNNPNDFGLPGGKVDPGETSDQALIREILEETGLEVVAYEGIFEDKDRVEDGELRPCKTYRVLAWKGELKTKEKGVVKWVRPSVITHPSTSFHEYNSRLFSHLAESGILQLS